MPADLNGPLPDDFPGRSALADAGINTYAQLRAAGDVTEIAGIGAATDAKITEALKGSATTDSTSTSGTTTKTTKGKSDLSPTAQWEADEAERADAARADARAERERRAGMTAEQRQLDDAKKENKALTDAEELAAMTPEERKTKLDKDAPLPPWQLRLTSGKVYDVRSQEQPVFVATDGMALDGADRAEAREFYIEYLTDASTIV